MKRAKIFLVWLVLIVVVAILFRISQSPAVARSVPYDEFVQDVSDGQVRAVRANNNQITVQLFDGDSYETLGVVDEPMQQTLSDHGALISWGEESNSIRTALIVLLPIGLLLAFFVYFIRKAQGGTANILSLSKSRHRVIEGQDASVTFADVGGCVEAKELLQDVIDFLRQPSRWKDAGARLPRGVLLDGPPGSGKTLLARAVAGETQAKFFLISASEFVEMFVGVGAARVRDMFETAAKQAPAVIFIDELDAVGRRRGSGIGAGHDEREQTLNQLLVCLDGFQANDHVVVVGATNRPDVLDPALLRAGRFDRRIKIPPLDEATRGDVLRIHTRNKPVSSEVDLEEIASLAAGMSGAQLENLANEAALLAVRRARINSSETVSVTNQDFQLALKPSQTFNLRFNKLDSLLIESAAQLAEPTSPTTVRLTLRGSPAVEGEVLWADASFLKIKLAGDEHDLLIPKIQLQHIEAVAADTLSSGEDVYVDRWATKEPSTA